MEATHPRPLPHLLAAVVAAGIVVAIILAGRAVAIHLERSTLALTAPEDFFIKNQGLAFQRAAARRDDVLLLYGSSELNNRIPEHAPEFFASAPTGFQVCPVGRKGFSSLVILQRIAALGSDLRNRKIAISISPSFFFHDVRPDAYAGNFSLPAASGALFGSALDWSLKSDLAKRMREFPETLAKSPLLEIAANQIARGDSLGHLVFAALAPLGKLQNAIYDLQDHFEALVYTAAVERQIPLRRMHGLFEPDEDANFGGSRANTAPGIARRSVEDFRDKIDNATEWTDMELLFRALKQLRTHALVLSLPLHGSEFDAAGIPRSARQFFYDRFRALADRYEIPLADFEDHDVDPAFDLPHSEHPSGEGWKYLDAALDKFFHQPRRYAWHQND